MGTPLFLATDILTGTSVTADNQPRIHARYGKQGLATKLTITSGVYNLKGVFLLVNRTISCRSFPHLYLFNIFTKDHVWIIMK